MQAVLAGTAGASEEERERLQDSLLEEAIPLSLDYFGNHVIQSLLDVATADQQDILSEKFRGEAKRLATDKHGCRVVQKALQTLPGPAQMQLAEELLESLEECIDSPHGNHVIQLSVEKLPADFLSCVILACEDKVEAMALHNYGCRVLQRLVESCRREGMFDQLEPLLEQVVNQAVRLSQDKHGNYVVQCILDNGRPDDRRRITEAMRSDVKRCASDKCASNVLEKCIKVATSEAEAGAEDEFALATLAASRHALVRTLLGLPSGGTYDDDGDTASGVVDAASGDALLAGMLEDSYGNYTVQCLIRHCKGEERELVRQRLSAFAPRIQGRFSGQILTAFKEEFGDLVAAAAEEPSAPLQPREPCYPPPPPRPVRATADGGGGGATTATDDEAIAGGGEGDEGHAPGQGEEDRPDEEAAVASKIFVGRLPHHCDSQLLRDYFQQFGVVEDAWVVNDKPSGRPRGFGFVRYRSKASVDAVMDEADKHYIEGARVAVERAVAKHQMAFGGSEEERLESLEHPDDDSKIFVGGLPPSCTDDSLADYFGQFGVVVGTIIKSNRQTGKPRGFGFVTFDSPEVVEAVVAHDDHHIDGKWVEVRRASQRPLEVGEAGGEDSREGEQPEAAEEEQEQAEERQDAVEEDGREEQRPHPSGEYKVFLGGLPLHCTTEMISEYFTTFGTVIDCIAMKDKQTGKPRGFGFVTFDSPEPVEEVLSLYEDHRIDGKWIEVKSAEGKDKGSGKGVPPWAKQDGRQWRRQQDHSGHNDGAGRPASNFKNAPGRIFVGALTPECKGEDLHAYFRQFGKVSDAFAMIDKSTGKARGFGFVTFENPSVVDIVMERFNDHEVCGRWVEVRRSDDRAAGAGGGGAGAGRGEVSWKRSREEAVAPGPAHDSGDPADREIYVGGIPAEVTDDGLAEYFGQFGHVTKAVVKTDKETGRSRHFGFITFASAAEAAGVVRNYGEQREHRINGRLLQVRREKRGGGSGGGGGGGGSGGRGGGRGAGTPHQPAVPPPHVSSGGGGATTGAGAGAGASGGRPVFSSGAAVGRPAPSSSGGGGRGDWQREEQHQWPAVAGGEADTGHRRGYASSSSSQGTSQGASGAKIFVGGLAQHISDAALSDYFMQFGIVAEAVVMRFKDTGVSRGFGLVSFVSPASVDAVLSRYNDHHLEGKWVEVKRADMSKLSKDSKDMSKGGAEGGWENRGGSERRDGGNRWSSPWAEASWKRRRWE